MLKRFLAAAGLAVILQVVLAAAQAIHVTLSADGRLEDSKTLDREDLARRWLTEFEKLDLFSAARLEPNAEYYVRVRARTTPRSTVFVWPWQGTDVAGLGKFTF